MKVYRGATMSQDTYDRMTGYIKQMDADLMRMLQESWGGLKSGRHRASAENLFYNSAKGKSRMIRWSGNLRDIK